MTKTQHKHAGAHWPSTLREGHLSRVRLVGKSVTPEQEAKWVELSKQASEWREIHCWNPARLRHNFGTAARREAGIEAARVTLGHSNISTSEIYAEADQQKARQLITAIG